MLLFVNLLIQANVGRDSSGLHPGRLVKLQLPLQLFQGQLGLLTHALKVKGGSSEGPDLGIEQDKRVMTDITAKYHPK